MRFVVPDAKFFKNCVDAIVNVVDEGTFELLPEELHLRTVDPSQIAMVDFHLPKAAFESIEVEEKALWTVNLADFSKVLGRTRDKEKLSASMEEKESRLVLEFDGSAKRRFKLPLLEASNPMPREPKVVFDSEIKIRGGALKDMLRDAGLLSSHVIFEANADALVLEAKGDSGDLRVESGKDSAHIVELKSTASSRAMFPFEYLDDITRACPEDGVMLIQLKTNAPIRVSYDLGVAKLAYFLAPRVENV